MMSGKLLWLGLTFIVALAPHTNPLVALIGACAMILGLVLLLLDK